MHLIFVQTFIKSIQCQLLSAYYINNLNGKAIFITILKVSEKISNVFSGRHLHNLNMRKEWSLSNWWMFELGSDLQGWTNKPEEHSTNQHHCHYHHQHYDNVLIQTAQRGKHKLLTPGAYWKPRCGTLCIVCIIYTHTQLPQANFWKKP